MFQLRLLSKSFLNWSAENDLKDLLQMIFLTFLFDWEKSEIKAYWGMWSDIEVDILPVWILKSLLLINILSIRVAEWEEILVGEVISGRK